MCDDRERLIGYVYDECDAVERRQIDEHLAGCEACRLEVAGLRAVREDLLAWDVPSHASIWRPVTSVRQWSWRDVPAWALAAAAALILMTGAVGGVAGQALLSRPAPAIATVAPDPAAAAQPALTAADLAAFERRLATVRAELRAEMDDRVRRVSAEGNERAQVAARIGLEMSTALVNDFGRLQQRLGRAEDKVDSYAMAAETIPASFRQGQ